MNTVYIICPPYPEYKEQPKDMSKCELFDCGHCKGKMWLSERKKGVLMFAAVFNKDIFLACYNCFEKHTKENPIELKEIEMRRL